MPKPTNPNVKPFDAPIDLADRGVGRRPVQIGKDTLMPLGMVGGLMLGIVGCYTWLDARFDGLAQNSNSRFAEIATGLHHLEDRLRDLELKQHHHWDSLDMKDWMLELKRLNPELHVPPVPTTEG
jgi:hypothetical protein